MSQDELTDFTAVGDQYNRVVEEQMIGSKKRRATSLQYMRKIDEKLLSEMAEIKAKIDQVRSDAEENRQQLLNAFRSRSTEYENKLKNESEKLNKLYQEVCNYKTSHDEFYGDEFRKFQAEKEQFMAWLVESRNMGNVRTFHDHIERVNYCIKRWKKVRDNVADLVALHMADSVDEMRVDPQPQHEHEHQHHGSLPPRGAV